jgi:hypothetical protein
MEDIEYRILSDTYLQATPRVPVIFNVGNFYSDDETAKRDPKMRSYRYRKAQVRQMPGTILLLKQKLDQAKWYQFKKKEELRDKLKITEQLLQEAKRKLEGMEIERRRDEILREMRRRIARADEEVGRMGRGVRIRSHPHTASLMG